MTLLETAQAIADALEPLQDDIPDLQIQPFLLPWPTPPAIDIYPAVEFGQAHTQGRRQTAWTVRARVGTADHEAGQTDLYRLMEPDAVWGLLRDMTTSELAVQGVTGPSGFLTYLEPQQPIGQAGMLLGCEWEVTVVTEAAAS